MSDHPETLGAILTRNWWIVAIRGLLAILFSLVAFAWPAVTMLSLVLVFAAYAFADGAFAIIAAWRAARGHRRWGLLVLNGVAGIIAAAIALLWPGITVVAFVLLLAIWALVSGGLMLMAAFDLPLDHGRGWLALGGLASIVYGVLLIVAPLAGALVLTWWIGAYALVFGVMLLVLAVRLRAVSAA